MFANPVAPAHRLPVCGGYKKSFCRLFFLRKLRDLLGSVVYPAVVNQTGLLKFISLGSRTHCCFRREIRSHYLRRLPNRRPLDAALERGREALAFDRLHAMNEVGMEDAASPYSIVIKSGSSRSVPPFALEEKALASTVTFFAGSRRRP